MCGITGAGASQLSLQSLCGLNLQCDNLCVNVFPPREEKKKQTHKIIQKHSELALTDLEGCVMGGGGRGRKRSDRAQNERQEKESRSDGQNYAD